MQTSDNTKNIKLAPLTVSIPFELKKIVKIRAIENQKKLNDLIKELLIEYVGAEYVEQTECVEDKVPKEPSLFDV